MKKEENQINNLPEGWEITTLENDKLFSFTNGLWKGKKSPYIYAKVLRNTNFNNDGTLDLEDVAEFEVEKNQFEKRQLSPGDIILERSGGGPFQPVGRVVYFDIKEGLYSFSNFTTRIRVNVPSKIEPKYLLYSLLNFYNNGGTYELQQKTTGIRNLTFSEYKKTFISFPTFSEQKTVSFILSEIQKAIKVQDEIIKTTQELKKSTMQHLFTHGLHGEKTKQTEIGEIPESWKLKQIKEIIIKTEQINPLHLQVKEFEYIDVSSINRDSLKIESATTTLKTNAPGRARKLVKTGDTIIATVRPTLKRLAYIEEQYDNQICSTAFCVLRSNPDFMEDKFLFYVMQQPYIYGILETMQGGASYPAVTDKNIHSLLIALPSKQEQVKITHLLENIDNKIYTSNFKKTYLQELFNSMLNELMTGQINAKGINFNFLEGKADE